MSEMSKQTQVVTLQQLNQDTAGVIQQLHESGEPAMLTRMGRPLAVIYPLPEGVESVLATRAYEAIEEELSAPDIPPSVTDDLDQRRFINRVRAAWRVWCLEHSGTYPNKDGRYGIELRWWAYFRKPRTWEDLEMPPRLEAN